MGHDNLSVESINSLAEKIHSLGLTDGEQVVLDELLHRAANADQDVDVVGFAAPPALAQMPKLNQLAKPFAAGLGLPVLRLSTDMTNPNFADPKR